MRSRIKKWRTDWSIEERVDPISGRIPNRYYFRKRLCGRVKLEGSIAARAAGYHLIEKDLRNITEWLNQIQTLMKEAAPNDYVNQEYFIASNRSTFQIIKGLFVATLLFTGSFSQKPQGGV